jgi:hypothetical protein
MIIKEDLKMSIIRNKINLGLLIRHNTSVPTAINPENALDKAVKLGNKVSYKAPRYELYLRKEDIISKRFSAEDASRGVEDVSTLYFTGSMSERRRFVTIYVPFLSKTIGEFHLIILFVRTINLNISCAIDGV